MTNPLNQSLRTNQRRALRVFCMGACLLVCGTGSLLAQQASDSATVAKSPAPAAPTAQTETKNVTDAATFPATAAVADPRQAQIVADTQKLVKLSQELKAEVAKSNKDTLSLTVIKKAEEVEKLAKTLKEELNKAH